MNYDDLGKRIRSLRKKQGMTQEQLANGTGMSPSFIGHIERGTRKVSLDTLTDIAKILGVSGSELMLDKSTAQNNDTGRASYRLGDAPVSDGTLMADTDDLLDSYLSEEQGDFQQIMLREIITLLEETD